MGTTLGAGAAAPAATVDANPAATLPAPIYWKQNLFLIPYQWSSVSNPAGAVSVWLLVSKDHGATWHKISEAKPHVKAFNYHAEGDGEYWFAIRTIGPAGRPPAGPYQPELRVIVDTTMPRIDMLSGALRPDGGVEIGWSASDRHLNPASWAIEVQTDPAGSWHAVTLPPPGTFGDGHSGHTAWMPPPGSRPAAIRATVYDLAGNSAVYRSDIGSASPLAGQPIGYPAPAQAAGAMRMPGVVASLPPGDAAGQESSGWVSNSAPAPLAADQAVAGQAVSVQSWPASSAGRAPFRISGGSATLADEATTYGNPLGTGQPLAAGNAFGGSPGPLDDAPPRHAERFRHASMSRLPPVEPSTAADAVPAGATPSEPTWTPTPRPASHSTPAETAPREAAPPYSAGLPFGEGLETNRASLLSELPPGVEPKWVGTRTFALEYEVEHAGSAGVAKVELWGTPDGGRTWRPFAEDDDHRSPLYVTVDSEGVYGFRICVHSADGSAAAPPSPGDRPELWVAVDLNRPRAELTSIHPGEGHRADSLLVRWQADDEQLDPRPISLFYSSRAAGPWTAIATGLPNSGQYAWRLERHVPPQFYLRLEARDRAGNLGAYQSLEPVVLEPAQPRGRLFDVEPVGPSASEAAAAYR